MALFWKRGLKLPHKRIEFNPLMQVPLQILLSADNPLAEQASVSLADLENQLIILLDQSGSRERDLKCFGI